jgi:hypothetical protein
MQSDRFAREIVPFLMLSDAARSRRLMRKTLGCRFNSQRFGSPALWRKNGSRNRPIYEQLALA